MPLSLGQLLPKKTVTAHPGDDLRVIYERARPLHIRHIAVTDAQEHFLGVITWPDLESAACNYSGFGCVRDLERQEVETVDLSTHLQTVIWRMLEENVELLAVTKDGKFVGLIEHDDLVRLIIALITRQPQGLEIMREFVYRSPLGQVAHLLSDAGI